MNRFVEGEAPGVFFGFQTAGVYADQAAIDSDPNLANDDGRKAIVQPGDLIRVDLNGDGQITGADQTILGDPTPDFIYGLNFSGSVDWGATTSPCNVEYGVYAFGTQSLSLGGWTSGSRVSGMVGAAPRFEPGGAMNGTGVYFESDSFLSLGGNMDITGCGETRQSDFELADLREQEDSGVSGSFLFR